MFNRVDCDRALTLTNTLDKHSLDKDMYKGFAWVAWTRGCLGSGTRRRSRP